MPNKYKFYIIIGTLIMLLVWAGAKACRISDSYSKLEGRYDVLKKQAAADHSLYIQKIAKIEAEKKKLDENITAITAKIEVKEKDVRKLGEKLTALEVEYATLGDDKDAQIENLQAQVRVWSERFSLAVSQLEDKDRIIFDLKRKYDLQIQITGKWQADFIRQVELQKVLETQVASLKGKLRTERFKSNLKTYLVIAVAGYVGYQAIKK